MRAPVVRVMTGISIVVVGVSLRASRHPSAASLGVQPAGIVDGTGSTGTPGSPAATAASTAPRVPRPSPRPHPSAARPSATPHRSAPAAVPSHPPSARPVPTRHAATPSAAPAPRTVRVNGAPADTQYGPVQVQIDLRGGHIVAARAIEYPTDSNRDQEINSYAIPQLDDEAVRADSAQIDTVSGATYTSDGYRTSLQSALDAAHQAGAR